MPNTPRCRPIILSLFLLISLTTISAIADEIVTIEPGFEGQPIEAIRVIAPSLEPDTLAIATVPGEPPSALFSDGDYSQLEPASVPAAPKNIDLLELDFDIAVETLAESRADVAYNSSNDDYLVVYVRNTGGAFGTDIYGRRINGAGTPIGAAFPIIAESNFELSPRVIYNPTSNEFMVVCYSSNAGATHSILARIVPATGAPTGLVWDPFPSFTNANTPDIAFNPASSEYLVVSGQTSEDSILIRRLAVGTGTPQGSEAQFRQGDGVADAAPSVIVYPTTGEYVIFTERIDSGGRGIFGYKLNSSASSINLFTGFVLSADSFTPRIAADTGRGEIFMAWQLATDATNTVFNVALGPVNFTTGGLGAIATITNSSTDDLRPEVDYQAAEDDFLVTWWRVNATSPPIAAIVGGTTAGAQQNDVSSGGNITETAALAVKGSDSLVVWTESADIRGRLLGTSAPSLSVNPTSLDFGSSTTSLGMTLTNTGNGSLLWGTSAISWVTRSPGTDSFFDSQNITIGVDRASLVPGSYNTTLTFLVPDATNVDVPISVVVPNTAPTAPANPLPANLATGQPVSLTLDWTSMDPDVGQNLIFDFYLSTNEALVNNLDASVRLGSDFNMSEALVSNLANFTTYFWRIVAKDGVTTTNGPTWNFSTARVGTTTLTPIANLINDSTPAFQWSAVPGAASYTLRVATDAGFSAIALAVPGITGTSHTPATPLSDDQYFWTVVTVAANGTESLTPAADSFTLDATAPPVPSLNAVSSPTPNVRPTFTWSASVGASSYDLEIATDAAFSTFVLQQTSPINSFTPSVDLPEAALFWRVAASDDANNQSAFSAIGSFEIDLTAPPVPTLIAALDPTGDARQTMYWNASTGASSYRIQVSDSAAFSTPLFDQAGLAATSFTPSADLPEGTIYWRVLAADAASNSSVYSAADSFTVDLTAPAVPTLNALIPDPINEQRPELTWSAVAEAVDYVLEVSETAFSLDAGAPDKGGILFGDFIAGTSWTPSFDLPEGPIFWRIASRDDAGNHSAFSTVDEFTIDVTAAAVPTLNALSPNPTADLRPDLSWGSVTDAVAYRVQLSTDLAFGSTLHDVSIAATSYTPSSDLPEGTIYWRVASRDSANNDSAFSTAESFDVDVTPPGVPVLAPVTPDPTSNRRPALSWAAVSGATNYRVQVSANAGFATTLFDLVVSGLSYTPTADLPEGTIFWRVASRDALANESAFSGADSFTLDITAPGVPTLTPVTPDPTANRRPTLTWSAVGGAAEYRVQVSASAGFATTLFDLAVSGLSYTPTADLPEGTIFWRLASRDALANESTFSAADSFTLDITPPAVPTPTPVTPDPTANRRPTLTWSAVGGAAEYRVQVSANAGFATTLFDLIVSGPSYTPTADLPEGTLFWRVASRDALTNESAFSDADSFTLDITAPGVPTLTPVTPDPTANRRPTLTWSTVGDAAEYRVQVSANFGFATTLFDLVVSGPSYTPTADLPEGTLFWRVASRDALANESAFSSADSFTLDITAPAVPTLTPVTPDPTTNRRPTLAWDAVAGAADYHVQVSTSADFSTTLFDLFVTGVSWLPTADLPEGPIYWRVSSRDDANNESAFQTADSFTIDTTAADVPVLVPVTPDPTSNSRPTLAWKTVTGAADYHLQVAVDPSFATTLFDLFVSGSAWLPTTDLPENTIYWRVASRDALNNESVFSGADSFTIDITAPAIPALTPVTPDPTTDRRPTLAWSSVADAADYRVQVSTSAGFETTLFDLFIAGTSWLPTADLPDSPIYWRVTSRDALGNESAFSATDSFLIDSTAPASPVLTPVTPDPTTNPRPSFSWSGVPEAVEYRIVIDAGAGAGPIVDLVVTDTSFTPTSDLPEGSISWRVASRDALGNQSAFSTADGFTIDLTAPAAINSLVQTWDTTSSWTVRWQPSPATDFAFYAVYRETTAFTDTAGLIPVDTSITDTAEARFVEATPPTEDLYYAVVAVDAAGNALTSVQVLFVSSSRPFFVDGFESGDLLGWTSSSP